MRTCEWRDSNPHAIFQTRQPYRPVPRVYRFLFATLAPLIIVSCATTEPPRTSTITNTVKVEVPVPCIAAADIPPLPVPTPLAPGATHRQKDAALASDLQAMDDYAAIADPLLRKCAKP